MSSTKITILIAIIASVITVIMLSSFSPTPSNMPKKESAFDRIMRTGVIRCGYYVFPPIMNKDANTGEMSGITYDFMNNLAERAGLKVEWTTEVTWSNSIAELQTGRFDMICTPQWPDIAMGRAVDFVDPSYYSGLFPIVRKNNKWSTATLSELNSPDVTFAIQDGASIDQTTKMVFPKAKLQSLPPSASGGELYQLIISGKADSQITDRAGLWVFQKNNKEEFVLIEPENPVKLQSYSMAVLKGETDLLNFLNFATREMDYSGDIDRILRKWEPEPGITYLRRAKSFQ